MFLRRKMEQKERKEGSGEARALVVEVAQLRPERGKEKKGGSGPSRGYGTGSAAFIC